MRALSPVARRGAALLAVATGTVLASSGAVAEEASATSGLRLTWNAPGGCPSAAEVAADVARILSSTSSPRRALRADARVSGGGARWHLTLATTNDDARGERGERELDAPTCRAVADAAALILALAMDPSASSQPVPGSVPATGPAAAPATGPAAAATGSNASPAAATRGSSTPGASRAPTSVATRSSDRSETKHALLGASGAGNVGELPAPGVGSELVVGWMPAPLRFEIFGDAWIGQSVTLGTRPGVGGDLRELGLGARACATFPAIARIDLGPCVGGRVASIEGSGFGARTTFSGAATWANVSAVGFASLRLFGPFSARLALEATVPLARPTFVVLHDGVTDMLHRPALLGGKGTFGLEARFF